MKVTTVIPTACPELHLVIGSFVCYTRCTGLAPCHRIVPRESSYGLPRERFVTVRKGSKASRRGPSGIYTPICEPERWPRAYYARSSHPRPFLFPELMRINTIPPDCMPAGRFDFVCRTDHRPRGAHRPPAVPLLPLAGLVLVCPVHPDVDGLAVDHRLAGRPRARACWRGSAASSTGMFAMLQLTPDALLRPAVHGRRGRPTRRTAGRSSCC